MYATQRDVDRLTDSFESEQVTAQRLGIVAHLRSLGVDAFWRLPDGQINLLLHRLFRDRRIVVDDGAIVGIALTKHPRRRHVR